MVSAPLGDIRDPDSLLEELVTFAEPIKEGVLAELEALMLVVTETKLKDVLLNGDARLSVAPVDVFGIADADTELETRLPDVLLETNARLAVEDVNVFGLADIDTELETKLIDALFESDVKLVVVLINVFGLADIDAEVEIRLPDVLLESDTRLAVVPVTVFGLADADAELVTKFMDALLESDTRLIVVPVDIFGVADVDTELKTEATPELLGDTLVSLDMGLFAVEVATDPLKLVVLEVAKVGFELGVLVGLRLVTAIELFMNSVDVKIIEAFPLNVEERLGLIDCSMANVVDDNGSEADWLLVLPVAPAVDVDKFENVFVVTAELLVAAERLEAGLTPSLLKVVPAVAVLEADETWLDRTADD